MGSVHVAARVVATLAAMGCLATSVWLVIDAEVAEESHAGLVAENLVSAGCVMISVGLLVIVAVACWTDSSMTERRSVVYERATWLALGFQVTADVTRLAPWRPTQHSLVVALWALWLLSTVRFLRQARR